MRFRAFLDNCLKSLRKKLTISRWRSPSYRNQSIDMRSKSMEWFLYDRDRRHERVKGMNYF